MIKYIDAFEAFPIIGKSKCARILFLFPQFIVTMLTFRNVVNFWF